MDAVARKAEDAANGRRTESGAHSRAGRQPARGAAEPPSGADRELERLRWRCRRGMLELDLILARFLERCGGRLDAEQRRSFGELLERPDGELLDWALGRSEPAEAHLRAAVRLLRERGGAPVC